MNHGGGYVADALAPDTPVLQRDELQAAVIPPLVDPMMDGTTPVTSSWIHGMNHGGGYVATALANKKPPATAQPGAVAAHPPATGPVAAQPPATGPVAAQPP